jgi:hypothetical protein
MSVIVNGLNCVEPQGALVAPVATVVVVGTGAGGRSLEHRQPGHQRDGDGGEDRDFPRSGSGGEAEGSQQRPGQADQR